MEENLRAALADKGKEWLVEQVVRLLLDAHALDEADRRVVAEVWTSCAPHPSCPHDYYVQAGDHWLLVHNTCDGLLDESIAIAKHSEERALAGDGTHFVRGVHPDAVAHYVDGVLEGEVPNIEVKYGLENGRTAYWDPSKGAVIFEDGAGGGSVFTPRDGYAYFEGLS